MRQDARSVPKAPAVLLRGVTRDALNLVRLGRNAPRAQERIWVDPGAITRIYTRNPKVTPDFRRRHSGMVIDGDWDLMTEPLDQSWKIAACLERFRNGVPWEDTGIFERMSAVIRERGEFDSCRTMDDIRMRYAEIDALYDDIRTRGFVDDSSFLMGTPRLPGGVFVHIDRHGAPIFGAIGNHRMGISRALGLKRIPAQLGVVHPAALRKDALGPYRSRAQ